MSFNTEFIRFWTEDKCELQGLLFKPKSKSSQAIIHVHGLAGNFYENTFVEEMAKEYTAKGFMFLVFNNRGHDYLTDIYLSDGSSKNGGGAYEKFEDCIYDIDACISHLKDLGISSFILQGHSSGSNKIMHYYYQKKPKNIDKIILLSPCDDMALQLDEKGDVEFERLLELASKSIENKEGNILMPEGSFFSYPISREAYYEYFKNDSTHDIFHYNNQSKEFKELNSLDIPIFIRFGNNGEYLLSEETAIECLKKEIKSDSNIGIIDGASHSYRGFEDKLVKDILNWL